MNLPVESTTQVAHSQRQELFDEFNGLMNLPTEESTQIPQLDRLYRYQESVKEANAVSNVDESAIVNECVTVGANGYPVYYHPIDGVEMTPSLVNKLQEELVAKLTEFYKSIDENGKYLLVVKKSNRDEPYSITLTKDAVNTITNSLIDGSFFNSLLDDDVDPYEQLMASEVDTKASKFRPSPK